MSQTHTGAMKVRAKATGMTLDAYLSLIESGQKWCIKCKGFHDKSEFGKDCTRYDGLASGCLKSKRAKERKTTKGRPSPMRGKTFPPNLRGGRKPGFVSEKRGIPRTPEERQKISIAVRAVALRGEKNPAWKGGSGLKKHGDRATPEYRAWRKAVFERDGYTCLICTVYTGGGDLEAHHVKPYAQFPELRYDVGNGDTLCRYHHQHEVHDRSQGHRER